jgi:DNA-binding CsgD family transcriptional regulator/PAS domain-containing protein
MVGSKKILEVVARLYDAALDDSLWTQVLSKIEILLHANNVRMIITDKNSGAPIFAISSRHPESNGEYISYYASIDERWPRILKLPHFSPTIHERLFREGEMATSRVYNEFLVKYDAQSQTITRMDGPGGNSVVFSAIREKSRGAFDGPETETIRHLLPHILRAMQVHHAMVLMGAVNQSLASRLESAQLGAIFLDHDGRIIETNKSAASILKARDGLARERGFVKASHRQENAKLQTLLADVIAQGLATKMGSSGVLLVSRPSMLCPLSLLVVPISSKQLDFGACRPVAAIFVRDPENRLELSTEKLARLFGLTPAESRLAVALAHGQSLQDYVEVNALSKNTVRWLLKNVMSKTDTRRQAELVRLILIGPAGLGTPIDRRD